MANPAASKEFLRRLHVPVRPIASGALSGPKRRWVKFAKRMSISVRPHFTSAIFESGPGITVKLPSDGIAEKYPYKQSSIPLGDFSYFLTTKTPVYFTWKQRGVQTASFSIPHIATLMVRSSTDAVSVQSKRPLPFMLKLQRSSTPCRVGPSAFPCFPSSQSPGPTDQGEFAQLPAKRSTKTGLPPKFGDGASGT